MGVTRWEHSDHLDLSGRIFHLEVLRGGMNRLLFRSNRSQSWPTRIEIFFMHVQHLAVPTRLEGPVVDRLGPLEEHGHLVPWRLPPDVDLSVYAVSTRGGRGFIVAAEMAVEESSASASDPSSFFMMD